MPGFDGTGPMGQGPMTGGGRGFCAVPGGYAPGFFGLGRGGLPWGGGRGRGFGGGRGWGRGMGWGLAPQYPPAMPYDPMYDTGYDTGLQAQLDAMTKENQELKARLEQLERGS